MAGINAAAMIALSLSLVVSTAFAEGQSQPTLPYDNLKKSVSVDPFLATEAVGGGVTSDGMTALLTSALIKDGRFVVLERTGLSNVLYEQALGQNGVASAETSAKPGQLIGASAIVRGAVTKYEPVARGAGLNVGGPLGKFFGAVAGGSNTTSLIEISLRLIDTTTGEIISTSTAQGIANSTTTNGNIVSFKTGLSLGGNTFQNTPIGQAGEQAIVKAVEQIAAGMRNMPWTALVVDVDNKGRVYINAGEEQNVRIGMILYVYRKTHVFKDPLTGETLDVDMDKVGSIHIDKVRKKISMATVVTGEPPVRGDLLKAN